jgi:hypothetical protein
MIKHKWVLFTYSKLIEIELGYISNNGYADYLKLRKKRLWNKGGVK